MDPGLLHFVEGVGFEKPVVVRIDPWRYYKVHCHYHCHNRTKFIVHCRPADTLGQLSWVAAIICAIRAAPAGTGTEEVNLLSMELIIPIELLRSGFSQIHSSKQSVGACESEGIVYGHHLSQNNSPCQH